MADSKAPAKLGRYEIVRELGKGAMGVVYEGLDPNIGRRVAIKTARRDVMESSGRADEMMERFLREAKAAGKINHPNIITIYDADEEGGMAYIAMEFLEGGDLQDLIGQKRRMQPEEVVAICATVCEALATAHENGIVHRDVKPANILMPTNKPLKVADFGIARTSDSNLTQEGSMIGTPYYMSPEQFMGQRVDGRSDLFSVGIILYEILTGEKPFDGESLSTVMHKVIKVDPVEPCELNFSINQTLNAVIMKGLSKNPGQRYQNGYAFAAALRESLKDNPSPAVTLLGPSASMPAGAATVVAAAPPGADGQATVMSAALPGQMGGSEASVTQQIQMPAGSATMPMGAAPGGSVTQQVTAEEHSAAKKKLMAIVGGIVLVLAVLLGVVSAMQKPMPPAGTTPAQPPVTTPAQPVAAAPYYESVIVQVYLANTTEAYSQVNDNPDNTAGLETDFPDPVEITVTDTETNQVVGGKLITGAENPATIKLSSTTARNLKVTASKQGYESDDRSPKAATEAKDKVTLKVTLAKQGL